MKKEIEYKKCLWTKEEDRILLEYIKANGEGKWNRIPQITGLKRCGKSCRLRWLNYLRPSIKRGDFSEEEEDLIIRLHKLLGNRWSLIAGRVPGRTDNQVKNHFNTHLRKKLGIKKQQEKNITSTAAKSSTIEAQEIHKIAENKCDDQLPQNSTDEITNQDPLSIDYESFQLENLDSDNYDSFLFYNDHFSLNSPNLDYFVDPVDLIWHNYF